MTTENTSPQDYFPSPLDPTDWTVFRNEGHRLFDRCIDHLVDVRNRPWRPLSDADRTPLSLDDPTRHRVFSSLERHKRQ